ncbi:hypothetical protein DE146DRAFT_661903 [Phaeosphaeria sp. MPI-PUGE-AT-0046c]|nr:hypothetical protein DE146DRAFT_661903 [Phaeosphaeria sp. MPI-PUGE-AT-0046c]
MNTVLRASDKPTSFFIRAASSKTLPFFLLFVIFFYSSCSASWSFLLLAHCVLCFRRGMVYIIVLPSFLSLIGL